MITDLHARLCARLVVLASASCDAARAALHPHTRQLHLATAKAHLFAAHLAEKDLPGLLQAAAQVLDDDVVGGAVLSNQFRAPKAAQLARHLLANLRLGAKHFNDGVLPVAQVDGQEAVDRAAKAHDAAKHGADGAAAALAVQAEAQQPQQVPA